MSGGAGFDTRKLGESSGSFSVSPESMNGYFEGLNKARNEDLSKQGYEPAPDKPGAFRPISVPNAESVIK